MSPRRDFVKVAPVAGGKSGGMNSGVYVVKSRMTSKLYVEKRLAPKHVGNGVAHSEIAAMGQCKDHPSIIHLEDWDFDTYLGYGSIYMQYCELGSLSMVIKEYHKRGIMLPDEGFLWQILWDMSLALCYLYNGTDAKTVQEYYRRGLCPPVREGWNKIIHRDIKPGNLFLTWANTRTGFPTVVLGDFGLCVTQAEINMGMKHPTIFTGGTADYSPPESPHFGPASDVYQLGMVLHCVGRMLPYPFENRNELENYPLPSMYKSQELHCLVKACLRRDCNARPAQRDLPPLVLKAYENWAMRRNDGGKMLPSWALPGTALKYY